MSGYDLADQIQLIKSLCKGREDVFAIGWESSTAKALADKNKRGYMPAYDYDPYLYRLHKTNGGSFADTKCNHLLIINQLGYYGNK